MGIHRYGKQERLSRVRAVEPVGLRSSGGSCDGLRMDGGEESVDLRAEGREGAHRVGGGRVCGEEEGLAAATGEI